MNTERVCPNCGKTLPPDVPLGLCPGCLIKSGFPTGSEEEPGARFVPPTVEEIAKLFPQLEILGFIGKGGMGAVYKARQPTLDRLVALKVLPPAMADGPGFAERFNREARALARLNHPNIVTVYDFGKVGALHYIAMEFVDGTNLREVERAGKLTPEQALAIVPQICEALQFAHNEGVVHRDIKPENLLLDKKGRLKITDFGIAKIIGLPVGKTSLTGAKDVVGTPHYMSPEQIEKPQTVDHRTDIYSLGVVFYEMLTGELPLGRFQPPSRKVHVDVRLDEIVLRTLEKEPERRYQQAGEVKTQVETIAATPDFDKSQSGEARIQQRMSGNVPGYFSRRLAIPVLALTVGIPCLVLLSFYATHAINNAAFARHSANQDQPIVGNSPPSAASQSSLNPYTYQISASPPSPSAKMRTDEPDDLREAFAKLAELTKKANALAKLNALEDSNVSRPAFDNLHEAFAKLELQRSQAQEVLARATELERMAKEEVSSALADVKALEETNWTEPNLSAQNLQTAGIYRGSGEFRKEFSQSFPLDANGRFNINDINGRIEIHGWNSNLVVLKAVILGKTAASVASVKIDVDSDPSRAGVHTRLPSRKNDSSSSRDWWDRNDIGGARVDYTVSLPLRACLEKVSTVNGTVVIGGMAGDISVFTIQGAAQIKNAAHNLKLSTVNGTITADMDKLGEGQSAALNAINGLIRLAVPDNADAMFSITNFNGSLSSDFSELAVKRQSSGGSSLNGSFRDGAASVRGNTVNGTIEILKPH